MSKLLITPFMHLKENWLRSSRDHGGDSRYELSGGHHRQPKILNSQIISTAVFHRNQLRRVVVTSQSEELQGPSTVKNLARCLAMLKLSNVSRTRDSRRSFCLAALRTIDIILSITMSNRDNQKLFNSSSASEPESPPNISGSQSWNWPPSSPGRTWIHTRTSGI